MVALEYDTETKVPGDNEYNIATYESTFSRTEQLIYRGAMHSW